MKVTSDWWLKYSPSESIWGDVRPALSLGASVQLLCISYRLSFLRCPLPCYIFKEQRKCRYAPVEILLSVRSYRSPRLIGLLRVHSEIAKPLGMSTNICEGNGNERGLKTMEENGSPIS